MDTSEHGSGSEAIAERIEKYNWRSLSAELDESGHAVLQELLPAHECRALAALYCDDARFRNRIQMTRHGFGQGEYGYFRYPLPEPIAALRTRLYPHLAEIATEWKARLGSTEQYPAVHSAYLRRCHEAGQTRPTPLLLKYVAGDFNRLHQDLYGDEVFPLQATILLSEPSRDFSGGEFVLTEQRPRMQSRVEVVPLNQGDAVIFAVRDRPVQGTRGFHRVRMRHGISRVRSGHRHALGIIFHDAH